MSERQGHSHEHEHEHVQGRERVQGRLKTAVLVGLGLYFVVLIASGNLTNYVNVRFSWLSYVAAGLFLLLGAASAYQLWKASHHDHDHEHDHTHLSWAVLAVAAIPLALGTLIPSEPLGASAVEGNISLKAVAVDSASAFSKAPLERNVLDWLREFGKSATPAAFNGQPADVIGFVYREPNFSPNSFMVARFAISCCVADASALGLPVLADSTATLADGDWVRVQGTFQAGAFRGGSVPILRASAVTKVEQPQHPYLYP